MQHKKRFFTKTMTVALVVMVFVFVLGGVVSAQVSVDFPTQFAGFSSQDLKTTIENIVRIVLGFIGVVFLIILLAAGLRWTTSGGDPQKIEQAKKMIASAVIGLLITLSAYSIASFIIDAFELSQSGQVSSGSGSGSGPVGFGFALGGGILESHYPGRNETGVPRNANILVTFKEDIDPTTVCQPYGGDMDGDGSNDDVIIPGSVGITNITNGTDPLDSNTDGDLDLVKCETLDNRTFKFNPGGVSTSNHLGTSNGNVIYQVLLTSGIKKLSDGSDAIPLGYNWRFTVSSVLDVTPPHIVFVYPLDGQSNVPRNSIVQITFNEPIDPTTAAGVNDASNTFDNIRVYETSVGTYLYGQFIISNGYKTVEFFTNEVCGTNSCGGTVYCLPGLQNMTVEATDFVTDIVGNNLDCETNVSLPSGDGTAGCSPSNLFAWDFDTSDNVDIEAPFLESRFTGDGGVDHPISDPVEATFNELISPSSVNTQNYFFDTSSPGCTISNWWTSVTNFDSTGSGALDKTTTFLHHDPFKPLLDYCPILTSNITDVNQNCYWPAACDSNGDNQINGLDDCANF